MILRYLISDESLIAGNIMLSLFREQSKSDFGRPYRQSFFSTQRIVSFNELFHLVILKTGLSSKIFRNDIDLFIVHFHLFLGTYVKNIKVGL